MAGSGGLRLIGAGWPRPALIVSQRLLAALVREAAACGSFVTALPPLLLARWRHCVRAVRRNSETAGASIHAIVGHANVNERSGRHVARTQHWTTGLPGTPSAPCHTPHVDDDENGATAMTPYVNMPRAFFKVTDINAHTNSMPIVSLSVFLGAGSGVLPENPVLQSPKPSPSDPNPHSFPVMQPPLHLGPPGPAPVP